jgi:hypothetical protein
MPVCPPTSRSGCSSGSKLVLLEPNPPAALDLIPRVLCLGLLRLRNLPVQHLLCDHPTLRVQICATHIDGIEAHIQDVPTAESA